VERAILARHGESELSFAKLTNGDPAAPCALTEAGRAEARHLGALLADTAIDLCTVSEFERVQETADVALEGRDVPQLVLPGLNDIRVGDFEGGSIDDYRAWARSHGPDDRPPGDGESRADVIRRYVEAYGTILARPAPTILVVGHALTVRYVLDAVAGRPPTRKVEWVPYAEPFPLTAAELSEAVERLAAWTLAPSWQD
jgi:broad specificity phosphatase PhoE